MHSAQATQFTDILGEDNALVDLIDNLICFVIPCDDESQSLTTLHEGVQREDGTVLSVSAPAEGDETGNSQLLPVVAERARAVATTAFMSFLSDAFDNAMSNSMAGMRMNNNGGGNRKLRGEPRA